MVELVHDRHPGRQGSQRPVVLSKYVLFVVLHTEHTEMLKQFMQFIMGQLVHMFWLLSK